MSIVYILQSQKNSRYYIGSTNDLRRRLLEHNRGQTASTRNLKPWVCVFAQEIEQARDMELKIKKLKSRVIIEKIVKFQSLDVVK